MERTTTYLEELGVIVYNNLGTAKAGYASYPAVAMYVQFKILKIQNGWKIYDRDGSIG